VKRSLGTLLDGPTAAGWTQHVSDTNRLSLLPAVFSDWLAVLVGKPQRWRTEGTIEKFQRILRSALSDPKPPAYIEDPKEMQNSSDYHQRKYHLTLDAVLKPENDSGKDESGRSLQDDDSSKCQAPPPYIETASSLTQSEANNEAKETRNRESDMDQLQWLCSTF
jgi:hypothetical protein